MPWWGITLRGMAMGAADVVPGVSGGTMALILGIYSRLVHAIKNIDFGLVRSALGVFRGGWRAFSAELSRRDLWFLVQLMAGIAIAILSFAKLIPTMMDRYPEHTRGLFFGMILASIAVPYSLMQRRGLVEFCAFAAMTVFAYWFSNLQALDVRASTWFLFLCGAIAICAMILPGISGAFLLLILGQYRTLLDAIHELDVVTIGVFGLGAVLGITSFSRLLSWLLDHVHSPTMAALCGLMVGSLAKIWPFKSGDAIVLEGKTISAGANVLPFGEEYGGPVAGPIVAAAVGLGLVVVLTMVGNRQAPVSTSQTG